MSDDFLPIFSSRGFMVSCLIFKLLSQFEFLFLYGVKVCSNFIDLHTAVQLTQHHWKHIEFASIFFAKCSLNYHVYNKQ